MRVEAYGEFAEVLECYFIPVDRQCTRFENVSFACDVCPPDISSLFDKLSKVFVADIEGKSVCPSISLNLFFGNKNLVRFTALAETIWADGPPLAMNVSFESIGLVMLNLRSGTL